MARKKYSKFFDETSCVAIEIEKIDFVLWVQQTMQSQGQ
jgi:hypothetical protein